MGTKPARRYDPALLSAEQKRELALQLRLSHKSWPEIAKALGVSRSTAFLMVQRVMAQRRIAREEMAERVAEQEVTRCEEIEAALWPNRGDPKHALALAVWTDRRYMWMGIRPGPKAPEVNRDELRRAIADALGIEVPPPKELPASQRILEVAASEGRADAEEEVRKLG